MGWYRRFVNVLRSNRLSTDIDREMAFHMAERTDDLMARGMSEPEARREARRRFGNPSMQKERTRDADVMTWLESVGADVRYAIRALRASPGFALVTIVSLGLGIGANTAIFSLINAVVLKTLPVSRPEELVRVTMGEPKGGGVFTNPLWEQIRDRQDMFSGVFAYGNDQYNLTAGGEVRRARGISVSGDFFSTLGVRPEVGRLLTRSDDVRGCPAVAVLGYGFWKSEFGGAPSAVGKMITLDRKPHVIIGVTPQSFFGVNVGESPQIYAPLCLRPGLDARSSWYLYIMGRPKPGVTSTQLATRVAALAPAVYAATVPERWAVADKANYVKRKLGVRPAPNGLSSVRLEYQKALNVLMAVVALVLVIACANVANLLLARAAVRGREMAIRLAIGAARRRLVRQLLTESVLLAGLGALAGALFARWGSAVLVRSLSSGQSQVSLDLAVDGRVLAFTLIVAVATGILFGLAPAWRSTRIDPQAALRAGGRGIAEGHTRFALGKALVVGQIALSLVLVIGAALLLGTFRNLAELDPGFQREGVLLVSMDLSHAGISDKSQSAVRHELLTRMRALPGVVSAAESQLTPISGSSWNDVIKVDGFTPRNEMDGLAYFNEVSDGYFATLGTSLLAGRDFTDRDRLGSPRVGLVNEAVVKKFFKGASPLGKTYRTKIGDSLSEPVEIVGVVKDAKYQDLREEILPTVYIAVAQDAEPGAYPQYAVRTNGAAAEIAPAIKSMVAEVNRSVALEFTPLSTQVDASLSRERLLASLSGFFGALALLLATVGLYGTLSYSVARRRNEIGIRIALGADQGRVMRLVLGEVTRLVVAGVIVGALAALASTRWVTSFLYGLSPSDPATVIGSTVVLALVGLAAGAMPAWRAARVEPVAALREE
jgi:putative ABC transport system permease protein